jgi:digeranylgeranylglycerophospholipid reductase
MGKNMQDAVVIGGGPAGSFFAFELAKHKKEVTVFEEHAKIGLPSHCTGHISIHSLSNLGLYPLPEAIVENTFSAANFYSPKGTKFSVHLSKPVTCAINREKFDEYLAEKAKSAGAKYSLGSKVQSLVIEGKFAKGVNVTQSDGTETRLSSRLVVDAEGVSSRLLRQAGLQALKPEGLVYGVEAEVENVKDVEEHSVEVYVGQDYAPGFYGWIVPRLDGSGKVGLATRKGNPKEFLDRLMRHHPVASKQLRNAKINSTVFHAITLGGPIPQAYGNGFLAVGDCASQVKPTTGGGVIFGITCSKIASEVAAKALEKGDLSSNELQVYQKRFMDMLSFDVEVMLKARKAINSFSDGKIDRALRFASRIGFEKTLRDIDEIDFQGRPLISMLRKPASYAALAYLLALYLPANA